MATLAFWLQGDEAARGCGGEQLGVDEGATSTEEEGEGGATSMRGGNPPWEECGRDEAADGAAAAVASRSTAVQERSERMATKRQGTRGNERVQLQPRVSSLASDDAERKEEEEAEKRNAVAASVVTLATVSQSQRQRTYPCA